MQKKITVYTRTETTLVTYDTKLNKWSKNFDKMPHRHLVTLFAGANGFVRP